MNALQMQKESDAAISTLQAQMASSEIALNKRSTELAEAVGQALGLAESHKATLETLTEVASRLQNSP